MKLAIATLALASCTAGRAAVPDRSVPAPPRPADCREIAEGDDLAAAIRAAADGDALCLAPGLHEGPVVIDRRVTLWGSRDAVIRARTTGTAVSVTGAGAKLEGFTVDGAGGSFDREDAAVKVTADDVAVEGLAVVHPVYGIIVTNANRVRVVGNQVKGDGGTAMGLRGDTIRFWEVNDSEMSGNVVEDGRDIVVFYSCRNHIVGNHATRGRYGTHLMFSDDNVVEDNRYLEGVVGVFVMYSHRDTLRRNLIADAGGEAGMAIGLKDSDDLIVEDNVLIRNETGVYLDDTPNARGGTLAVRGNVIRQTQVAVAFHTTPTGVTFEDNDLGDNALQAQATAGTDPGQARWHGNYYDDYDGYDLDGDGTGDVPHQARSASEDLIASHPELAFFRGGPVLSALDAASKLLPMWQPVTILTDDAPRMSPRDPEEVLDARRAD